MPEAAQSLPRRFACRPLDGHESLPPLRHDLFARLIVSLNGAVVDGFVAADADAGFVIAIERDESGIIYSDAGSPRLKRLDGRVEIRRAPDQLFVEPLNGQAQDRAAPLRRPALHPRLAAS